MVFIFHIIIVYFYKPRKKWDLGILILNICPSNKIEEHFEFFTRTLKENFEKLYLVIINETTICNFVYCLLLFIKNIYKQIYQFLVQIIIPFNKSHVLYVIYKLSMDMSHLNPIKRYNICS